MSDKYKREISDQSKKEFPIKQSWPEMDLAASDGDSSPTQAGSEE